MAMLRYLGALNSAVGVGESPYPVPHTTDRQLRLAACAWVRQVWSLLSDARCRRAVEVAELFSDGLATEEERSGAAMSAHDAYSRDPAPPFPAGQYGAGMNATAAACNACWHNDQTRAVLVQTKEAGLSPATQASLLRDIVGNPFRPVTLNAAWLTATAVSLARAAYEERPGRRCPNCSPGAPHDPSRWSTQGCTVCGGTGRIEDGTLDPHRLLVLADALLDAGCPETVECGECPKWEGVRTDRAGYYNTDAVASVIEWGNKKRACRCGGSGRVPHPLLAHLRGTGPHVRGCWALGLVLGQE